MSVVISVQRASGHAFSKVSTAMIELVAGHGVLDDAQLLALAGNLRARFGGGLAWSGLEAAVRDADRGTGSSWPLATAQSAPAEPGRP